MQISKLNVYKKDYKDCILIKIINREKDNEVIAEEIL